MTSEPTSALPCWPGSGGSGTEVGLSSNKLQDLLPDAECLRGHLKARKETVTLPSQPRVTTQTLPLWKVGMKEPPRTGKGTPAWRWTLTG